MRRHNSKHMAEALDFSQAHAHKCDLNGIDVICGKGRCRSCNVEAMFRRVSTWFVTGDIKEQHDTLMRLLLLCPMDFVDQVTTVLAPLRRKEMEYSLDLLHQKPQLLHRSQKQQLREAATSTRPITAPTPPGRRPLSRAAVTPEAVPAPFRHFSKSARRCKTSRAELREVDVQQKINRGMGVLVDWVRDNDDLCRIFMFKRLVEKAEQAALRSVCEQLNQGIRLAANYKGERCDIVSMLPKHLAKHIFSYIDYDSVESMTSVSKVWRSVCLEVLSEKNEKRDAQDYVLDLQAVCDPTFAQWAQVPYEGIRGTEQIAMFERNVFCGVFSVVSFPGDVWDVNRCAYFSGGEYVVTGARNKLARLWDAKTGKILRTLPGHAGGIEAVYLDEINNFMLTGSYDTTVRLWNVATGHCDATFDGCHSSTIVCLDADFASGFVVSGSKDKTVNVWQLDHAVKTAPLRRQGGPAYLYGAIRRLTMSPMSPPPPTMSPTSQTPGGGGSLSPSAAATPPSNTSPPLIRSGGGGGGGLFSPPPLTDTQMRESGAFAERARCLKTLQHTSEVLCVKLWSEGARGHARLATGTANGVLSYYDLGNGLCMKCINSAHRGPVKAVDLNKHYIVSGGVDNLVNIWNTTSGNDTPIKSLRHTSPVLCVQVNSLRVVSGAQDGKVRIWNLLSGNCIRIFRGNSNCDPIVSLSFGDHKSICVNTQTSMHVLYFDTSNETKKISEEAPNARALDTQRRGTLDRVAAYKDGVPAHRQATLYNFSGQWRSDELSQVAPPPTFAANRIRVVKPSGDMSSFRNSRVWTINDGHASPEKMMKQVKLVNRYNAQLTTHHSGGGAKAKGASRRRSKSTPLSVSFADNSGHKGSGVDGAAVSFSDMSISGGQAAHGRRRGSTPFRTSTVSFDQSLGVLPTMVEINQ